jgi:hypothetical protein
LLWFVPLDGHDLLFLQVDSLSFHLVQISPVTSLVRTHNLMTRFRSSRTTPSWLKAKALQSSETAGTTGGHRSC